MIQGRHITLLFAVDAFDLYNITSNDHCHRLCFCCCSSGLPVTPRDARFASPCLRSVRLFSTLHFHFVSFDRAVPYTFSDTDLVSSKPLAARWFVARGSLTTMMSSQYGNSRPNAGGSAPSLSDLVSQSRKLTSSIERERHGAAGLGTDLPAINLALDQLESQSRSLAAGSSAAGAQAGGSGDSKA